MRDAAEVRARVAGAARGRAEVRTPSPSSLSMVSGRSVLSHELQGKDRVDVQFASSCLLFVSEELAFGGFLKFRWWLCRSKRFANFSQKTSMAPSLARPDPRRRHHFLRHSVRLDCGVLDL